MTPVQVKRLEYAVAVDRAGSISAEDGALLALGEEWTPEHLVLAGLARCSLASLAYYAQRASLEVSAAASASGAVTRRDEDGRFAFVELSCRIEAELDPAPAPEALAELIAKAERGCFVGASLRVTPSYSWRVNGEDTP